MVAIVRKKTNIRKCTKTKDKEGSYKKKKAKHSCLKV